LKRNSQTFSDAENSEIENDFKAMKIAYDKISEVLSKNDNF
jgi:hypothetical protein